VPSAGNSLPFRGGGCTVSRWPSSAPPIPSSPWTWRTCARTACARFPRCQRVNPAFSFSCPGTGFGHKIPARGNGQVRIRRKPGLGGASPPVLHLRRDRRCWTAFEKYLAVASVARLKRRAETAGRERREETSPMDEREHIGARGRLRHGEAPLRIDRDRQRKMGGHAGRTRAGKARAGAQHLMDIC
jgi:hypothetical protein